MKVATLLNWGMGLEVLKTLHHMDDVKVAWVGTTFRKQAAEPWRNAVHDFAATHGYPIFLDTSLSFDDLKNHLEQEDVDLLVVHAFMRKLPQSLFCLPKHGSINIHASLLPQHRGPSPTYWVLRNKERRTGLTCHYIDEGIDSGDLIYQVEIPVHPGDTVETIIERQKERVPHLMRQSLNRIRDATFQATPQDHGLATYAPRPNT